MWNWKSNERDTGRRPLWRVVSTLVLWLLPAVVLAMLPGCGSGDGGSTTAHLTYLIPPDATLPGPDGNAKLTGEDATGTRIAAKSLVWSSSDNSVVSVDSSGNLTPGSDGEVIITATQPSTGNTAHADVTVMFDNSNSSNAINPTDTPPQPTIPSTPPINGSFVREAALVAPSPPHAPQSQQPGQSPHV